MATRHRFSVEEPDAGERLDRLLAHKVTGLSRTHARKLIAAGAVFIGKRRVKVASRVCHAGQEITITVDAPSTTEPPSALPQPEIVFENDDVIVVNKPSGLFSAPTPEGDRSDLLFALRERYESLHLVHRLDRPTSGLMVLARHARAAAALSAQLQDKSVQRHYLAIVAGVAQPDEWTVEQPIADREAKTHFVTQKRASTATLVAAELATGRTHQIRIHATEAGHPVAGDSKYGRPAQRVLAHRPPRLALHAYRLQLAPGFPGEGQSFESAWPPELEQYWERLEAT